MNWKTTLIAMALAATACAAAPAAPLGGDVEAPSGDLARLQGKWTTKVSVGPGVEADITIKGRAVTVTLTTPEGQDVEIKGEIKLDERARPHRTIDWVKFTDPTGEGVADNFGIYEFDGEGKVKVCNGGPGNPRPTEFKEGVADAPILLVMTRKPAPAK